MAADRKCVRAAKTETTRSGGNIHVIVVDDTPRSLLSGTVTYPDEEAVDGALVEIFDHPENLQKPWEKKSPQKRIAACVTRAAGKYCFAKLPAGIYELRISKDAGINVTSVRVTIDAKKGTHEPVNVRLVMGT